MKDRKQDCEGPRNQDPDQPHHTMLYERPGSHVHPRNGGGNGSRGAFKWSACLIRVSSRLREFAEASAKSFDINRLQASKPEDPRLVIEIEVDHLPSGFTVPQREMMPSLLAQRDQLITLLARVDPAVADRLADAYGVVRSDDGNLAPARR